jgi:class 3 adenylate cyclase
MVRQHHPDVILLDLQMPKLNGMQVLDALQEDGLDIPVILMTFHGSEEIAIEVYRKGVRDYVKKPYTVDEMLDALNRCLGEVRLRREKEALTERLLQANANLNRRIRELNALYQIGKNVTALTGMDSLMVKIVDAAIQVIGAEQASLLLLENNQLVCRAIRQQGDQAARPVNDVSSDKIAWHVLKVRQPAIFSPEDLRQRRATNPTLPSAALSIPLTVKDRIVGVLSVEMVSPDTRAFTQQDGAMLSALGDYAAIAIENTRIYAALEEATSREKELLRTAFERYVAPTVVDRIVQNPGVMMQLGGKRQTISVLFADVRGFTSYAEQANPEEVVKLLNEYFTLATEIIFTREGTLDKFQGDAVMAIFNAPEEQANHAYRAVDAAMALQRAITERNARIGGEGLTFGIGVHLGDAVVGNIGTTRAMNYTAIGDTVNVAKRLQERAAPGEVLITEDVCTALGDRVEAQVVGDLNMKGRQQVVRVYRLLSLT